MYTPTSTKALRGSEQRIYEFPNGLGASVISDGYGGESGHCELGVLTSAGKLTYSTPITNDVIGWLTEEQVQETLGRIAALTPEEIAAHAKSKELKDDWKWAVDSDETELGFEDWKAAR